MAKQEDKLTFAAMVLVAIVAVVGIIGLSGFQGITGAQASQTQPGLVNVTVGGFVDIFLQTNTTNFGSGYVNASHDSAEIESKVPTKINWINDTAAYAPSNMVLINNGTQVANVTIKADESPAEFIGGGAGAIPDPAQFFIGSQDVEATSCGSGLASTYTDLQNDTEILLCEQFNFRDDKDQLEIDYNLTIPIDATAGEKTNLITFTATAYSP
jgi:hypothetical protein